MMSPTKFSSRNLPTTSWVELGADEEIELVAEDITEFLVVFADEVFDSMPDPSDSTHVKIGDAIFKLFCELENQDYTFYEQIAAKYKELKAQKVEFIDGKFSDGENSGHADSDSEDPYAHEEKMDEPNKNPTKEDPAKKSATQTSEEFEKFKQEEEAARQKKKAKKNQGFGGAAITEEEQQKIDEEIKQLAQVKEQNEPEAEEGAKGGDDDDWETA